MYTFLSALSSSRSLLVCLSEVCEKVIFTRVQEDHLTLDSTNSDSGYSRDCSDLYEGSDSCDISERSDTTQLFSPDKFCKIFCVSQTKISPKTLFNNIFFSPRNLFYQKLSTSKNLLTRKIYTQKNLV